MHYYDPQEVCTVRDALVLANIDPDTMPSIERCANRLVVAKLPRLLLNGPGPHVGTTFVTAGGSVLRQWSCVAETGRAPSKNYFATRWSVSLVLIDRDGKRFFDVQITG